MTGSLAGFSHIKITRMTVEKGVMYVKSLFLMISLLFSTALLAEDSPRVMVVETSEQVRVLLAKEDGNNTDAVRVEVEGVIFPRFDFSRMAALAVGKHWKQAAPEQKAALAHEFRTLLARTYFTTMLRYRDAGVEVRPDVIVENEGKEATVKTDVRVANAQAPVLIDYVLYKTNEGWKVFNVIVEGASLVTVYRNQFGEEVSKGGIDGLINTLRAKNKSDSVSQG